MNAYSRTALQQQLAQCQQQLQASERRFRNIIEKNADGILIIDRQGVIRFANPAIEEILGRKMTDLPGAMFGFPVVANKTTELDIIHQGQVRAIVEMRVMKTEWDGETAYVASLRDITERKKAEETIRIAKENAEAANRAKGNFLANISHELRTPLNAILGYAQILQRDPFMTEKQQHGLDIIKQNGEHLLTLLNDILDISKIEMGKFDLFMRAFDVDQSLKSVIEMTRLQAKQKNIAFFYERDDMLPEEIYGDDKRLRQILLNLLGNAVKFTKHGGVTFRVKLHRQSNDAPQAAPKTILRFEVQDTGVGISAEHLQAIFLPFEQVHDAHSNYDGVGLGLAISRHLLRKMGSELYVESLPEKGSTFWFDLDIPETFMKSHDPSHPTKTYHRQGSRSVSSSRIIGYHGKLRRILLADHHESCRKIVKDMLLPVGFEIVEALNGQDTINKTRSYRPDAILIDAAIPVVGGLEVIRRIRQQTAGHDTVILAISANNLDHAGQEHLAAEYDGFLTKPISELLLFDMLQSFLNITWIYENDHEQGDGLTESALNLPNDRSLRLLQGNEPEVHYCRYNAIPAQEEIRSLYDLAMMGDVLAIRERIEEIDRRDPGYALFVSKVRKPAQALNMMELQRVLQEYLEQHEK